MNMKFRIFLVLACCILSGCDSTIQNIINRKPIIHNLEPASWRLQPNDSVAIVVTASDPDDDRLGYDWTKSGGEWLSGTNGDTVLWLAPLIADDYVISVKVTDENGASVEKSITLKVIEISSPEVKILEPENNAFRPGVGIVPVRVEASHDNGIDRVEFYLKEKDGMEELKHTARTIPYDWEWDVTGLNGEFIVRVKAYQAADPGVNPRETSIVVFIEGVSIP